MQGQLATETPPWSDAIRAQSAVTEMPMPYGIDYREATPLDAELLWRFLAIAAYEADARTARRIPIVAAHLNGWRRPGDFGVVAQREGRPVGAAWARQFDQSEGPVFLVGAKTPELSLGVLEEERGKGVGLALLRRLETMAKEQGLDGLCLNVRDSNPALRLYQRAGYRLIKGAEVPNRVGGVSFGMLLAVADSRGSEILLA
jgi:GNAT superfamily N-acetyltransferase